MKKKQINQNMVWMENKNTVCEDTNNAISETKFLLNILLKPFLNVKVKLIK